MICICKLLWLYLSGSSSQLTRPLAKNSLALRSGSSILSEVQTERWKLLIENYPNYPLRGLRSTRALSAAPEGAMNTQTNFLFAL